MVKLIKFTKEFREQFHQITQTDEFAELLGIVWHFGNVSDTGNTFEIYHTDKEIVTKFSSLARGSTILRLYYNSKLKSWEWYCNIHIRHPLVAYINKIGWSSISWKERMYPQGYVKHNIFIRNYMLMRYDLKVITDHMKCQQIRIFIYGSYDILKKINEHLQKTLEIKYNQLLVHQKHTEYVLCNYSIIEIPIILEYMQAWEELDKFHFLNLNLKVQASSLSDEHVLSETPSIFEY